MAKFPVLVLVAILTASSVVFTQTGVSSAVERQNHKSELDARQIMKLSVTATQRNWHARDNYTYTERDENQRLDTRGQVKSENVEVTKIGLVNGAHFEKIVEHDGKPPTAEEEKNRENFDKLKHETPAARGARLSEENENIGFLSVVLDAFDVRLIGEEMVDAGSAYVLQATPHPGYHARGKYGKLLSKVEGKLWIDKQDFGCIKADGQVTEAFSMGLFVARVQRGSRVILDEVRIGDEVWVPKRMEVRASAKILFLKSLEIDRTLTYSDYDRVVESPHPVDE